MKKHLLGKVGASLLALSMILAGCGGGSGNENAAKPGNAKNEAKGDASADKKLAVGYYVSGNLGDSGFFDSAKEGLDRAEKDLGVEVKTVQGGANQSDWPTGLESMVASKKYEVIVVGTSQMKETTIDLAKRYPEQKFIYFDETITDVPNIYSVKYNQREGSFLAGAFAAMVTTSKDLDKANPDKTIGFLGGMDIPIINDFKAGYEQGAHFIDPEVKVISSFVGDFNNAPKGKELSLAQFNSQNVDIIFNVAGPAGIGGLEAAKEANKYAIGVNSNQNMVQPGHVLTSMLKNVGNSIYRALDLYKKDQLPFGENESLGIYEEGVGLAKDDLYNQYVPQAIRDKMDEIQVKVVSGEIKIN
ncbi:BMP family ABC transporter substrate-binding protein [Brevibacillus ruminantium]|uniref:BMP family ABC transporter substrate-binding protein n=1 Tax=Brevibacillus ruminantium TaxID=2950604 RepID=A0ABY4WJE1_9BACL|nr:BMP family ABC transporter substrate-binding protein [Brevibacillus ruminantium]USG66999.1 BMP family ABC transporter substrate-binding protein [Brevibacillus ruminantium]